MVQSSSSGDAGLSFKNAIKAAAEKTRTGFAQTPAADETIAKLTSNQGRFGVPPQVIQNLAQQTTTDLTVEQGDRPEGPREG